MAKILTAFEKFQRNRFIQSSAIRGFGANKTIESLKGMGLPMRRTDALKVYRDYAGIPAKEDPIKNTRKQLAIGKALYTNQHGHMHKRYRYIIKYQTYNKTTGELRWYKTGVISNTEMLPWQIEREGEKAVAKGLDRSPFDVRELYVAEAHHRAGDTWQ